MKRLFLFLLLPVYLLSAQNHPIRKQVEQLIKTHRYDQAEKILLRHKDKPDALYYLAVVDLVQGKLDKAVDRAEEGLKKDTNKARFYELLGDIYAVKAQNSGMLSLIFTVGKIKKNWQKAIALDSTRLSAYQKLFSFYLMAPGFAGGDKDEAFKLAQKVLKINPPVGQTMLAQYYQKEKQSDKAEQAFTKALKLAPDSVNIVKEAAYFYLTQKKIKKARQLFDRILTLKPNDPFSYDALSDWYFKTGKKDSAIIVLDKALKIDSLNQQILFKKARFLADLGRYDESRALCNRLLKQQMFFALRKQILGFLERIKDK